MVGGTLGNPTTGTRISINDPANATSGSGGRYGRAMTPDDRFQVDQDNPTILAETGFPMCIPRVAPSTTADDALCPQANRPAVSNPVVDTSGITPQPNTLIAGEHYRMFPQGRTLRGDPGFRKMLQDARGRLHGRQHASCLLGIPRQKFGGTIRF